MQETANTFKVVTKADTLKGLMLRVLLKCLFLFVLQSSQSREPFLRSPYPISHILRPLKIPTLVSTLNYTEISSDFAQQIVPLESSRQKKPPNFDKDPVLPPPGAIPLIAPHRPNGGPRSDLPSLPQKFIVIPCSWRGFSRSRYQNTVAPTTNPLTDHCTLFSGPSGHLVRLWNRWSRLCERLVSDFTKRHQILQPTSSHVSSDSHQGPVAYLVIGLGHSMIQIDGLFLQYSLSPLAVVVTAGLIQGCCCSGKGMREKG